MSTVIEILNFLLSSKLIPSIPELITLLILFITIPVTVAIVKRSFSKLKIVKSYLRSSISQERLDGLPLLSMESEECLHLNFCPRVPTPFVTPLIYMCLLLGGSTHNDNAPILDLKCWIVEVNTDTRSSTMGIWCSG